MEQPKNPEQKAGYLVIRMRPMEGVVIGNKIEVRLTKIDRNSETGELQAHIAIKAPREILIRRVR